MNRIDYLLSQILGFIKYFKVDLTSIHYLIIIPKILIALQLIVE